MSTGRLKMKRFLALVALSLFCLGPAAAMAGDSDESSPSAQASKGPSTFVRSDSLEMPGVTACHQCEWRPKPNQIGAADLCGTDGDGKAHLAEFECGFSEDCQRVCTFVRCLAP